MYINNECTHCKSTVHYAHTRCRKKNCRRFWSKNLSVSPDSRYIAIEYLFYDSKKLKNVDEFLVGDNYKVAFLVSDAYEGNNKLVIFDVNTLVEVDRTKAGYPWAKSESSQYTFEFYKAPFERELIIKDKKTGRKLYGIDEGLRRQFSTHRRMADYTSIGNNYEGAPGHTPLIAITSNNQYVIVISYPERTWQAIYNILAYNTLMESGLRELAGESPMSKQEMLDSNIQSKKWIEEVEKKETFKIEVFNLTELPVYRSYPKPTILLKKEGVLGDKLYLTKQGTELYFNAYEEELLSFCGNYMARKREYSKEEFEKSKYSDAWGVVNRAFEEIVPFTNKSTYVVSDELVGVWQDKDRYLLNPKSKQKIICEDYKNPFSTEGFAIITDENLNFSLINNKGKIIFPPENPYSNILLNARDGYFAVSNDNNKYGVIDANNKIIIPFQYDFIKPYFSEGLIGVKKGNIIGFVHINNKLIIPFQYIDNATPSLLTEKDFFQFKNGRAKIKQNGKTFWIDKTGKCIEGCN